MRGATAVFAWIYLTSTVMATELTGSEIKDLISEKTVYLRTTAASVTGSPGRGAIYYAASGTALYKTPKGVIWHGTWMIRDNTLCADWKEAPDNPCTKFDKQGRTISVINLVTGLIRAKILKTKAGDAEKLAP